MDVRQKVAGAKIRAARHAAGMTQAALAHAVNTRERNIIRWENGQHEPRFEHVAAIAKATGKPLSFFDADPPEPDAGEPRSAMSLDMFDVLIQALQTAKQQQAEQVRA